MACDTPVPSDYIKDMSKSGHLHESLAAVVVNGRSSKLYLPPSTTALPDDNECYRRLDKLLAETPLAALDEAMNTADSTTVAGRGYGISKWRDLFTPRQLLVLFTFIKHVRRAHDEMLGDGIDRIGREL